MSVSGPCLWLPSPAAPPSHLAAISTPSSAWNQDQANPRFSSAENPHHHQHHLHSNPNTINTNANTNDHHHQQQQHHHHSLLPSVASTLAATNKLPSPYHPSSGYELMPPPKDIVDDRAVDNTAGDDEDHQPLSRTRLDKLNRRDSLLATAAASTSRKNEPISPHSPLEVVSPDRKRKRHDDLERQDSLAEGDMSSSEDGAGSPGGSGQASNSRLEKKKMKRFRLTHNQTRFLMSEFTRQAHPDAAHRERLSKEIPGLTPRQVQVWFQNRRAKLKRLTTNDRERMLKSRALPDDFDTTQVLRTPFDHKSTSETSILLTGGLQRSEDEYAMSPLSAPSAGGSYFSGSTERQDGYPTPSLNRPGVPAGLADMQRSGRAYPFSRSSSLSDAYSGIPQLPSRFSSPSTDSLGHPGMPYARRPMEYGMSRPNGMVPGYDPNRPMDGSVSPPDQQASPMPYSVDHIHNYQSPMSMPPPKPFAGLDMNSPMQPHARQIPSLHSVGVSESPDYRHYPYEAQPYSMNNSIPFTQANASSMNLPATFPPDTGHVSPTNTATADGRMNPPQIMDPMRAKYGGQSFDYTNYL